MGSAQGSVQYQMRWPSAQQPPVESSLPPTPALPLCSYCFTSKLKIAQPCSNPTRYSLRVEGGALIQFGAFIVGAHNGRAWKRVPAFTVLKGDSLTASVAIGVSAAAPIMAELTGCPAVPRMKAEEMRWSPTTLMKERNRSLTVVSFVANASCKMQQLAFEVSLVAMRETLFSKAFPHAHRKLIHKQAQGSMPPEQRTGHADAGEDSEKRGSVPTPTPPPHPPSRRIDPGLRALIGLKKRTGARRYVGIPLSPCAERNPKLLVVADD
eukprot:3935352-Rhodomonas_salina.5